ncbi:hypothetical protein ACET9H_16955 [Aeromonas media]|uniref:hypothetical protein n=1 Tax=Aeromonas media TaxID=651 RepID=UPI0038D21FEE
MTEALNINRVTMKIEALNNFHLFDNGSRVYTEGFKPTPAAIGAVKLAGDTMTGNLTAPAVLVSAAQNTAANALVRKDYVDSALSGLTNPTGVAPIAVSGTGAISISSATTSAAGSMSAADKTKLDGMPADAISAAGDTVTGEFTFTGAGKGLLFVPGGANDKGGIRYNLIGSDINAGEMEFYTADDASEPFVFRSYDSATTVGSTKFDWARIDAQGISSTNGFFVPSTSTEIPNRRYGRVKYLGKVTDAKTSLIILCEKYVSTALMKEGFTGRITYDRGTDGLSNITDLVDLSVSSGHTSNKYAMFFRNGVDIDGSDSKIVEVTYEGKPHYAFWRAAKSSSHVYIDGITYGSKFPILVPDASAYTTMANVSTVDQFYHGGSKPNPATIYTSKVVDELNFGDAKTDMTTTEFITLLDTKGAFDQRSWQSIGTWDWASNRVIIDTGCGDIHLAGAEVRVSKGLANGVLDEFHVHVTGCVKNDTGSMDYGDWIYSHFTVGGGVPSWRRLYNTRQKPTAADVGALPLSGGTMTGALVLQQGRSLQIKGDTDDSDNDPTLQLSTEAGYAMMWRTPHPTLEGPGKSMEFIGIGTDSQITFRKDKGLGDSSYSDYKVYHTGYKQSHTIGTPTELGANVDLDTLTTPGVYSQGSNAETSTALHYPEANAGSLVIYQSAGVVQEYRVYNSSRVWIRSKYSSSAWTAWAKQYNTLNKPTAADVGAAATSHTHSNVADIAGILNLLFPVGSTIYRVDTKTPTSLGYPGTWTKVAASVTLATGATDGSDVGTTSGTNAPAVPVPSHAHTGTAASGGDHTHPADDSQAGDHYHIVNARLRGDFLTGSSAGAQGAGASEHHTDTNLYPTTSISGGHNHNITVSNAGAHTHTITVDSAGVSSPTIDVQGLHLNGTLWIRTA